jgi:hypothetical protein
MKKLVVIGISLLSFSVNAQFNHDVALPYNKKFVNIGYARVVDSLNMNQDGVTQYELIEFHLDKSAEASVKVFMSAVTNVNQITTKYDNQQVDIVISSYTKKIKPLSGFYYGTKIRDNKLVLVIIYPRTDHVVH